jgi:hypothetical protein
LANLDFGQDAQRDHDHRDACQDPYQDHQARSVRV